MEDEKFEEFIKKEVGFVEAAHMSGALTHFEFLQWVDLMILTYDHLPTFMFDLMETKSIGEIGNFLPRHCYSGLSSKESETLWGIAYKRNPDFDEDLTSISRKTALKRLEQYPHVVERFKKTFPFIKLDF